MNTKKLLAILLCLTVMIGLFCVVVSAAEDTAPESAPAGNKDIQPLQPGQNNTAETKEPTFTGTALAILGAALAVTLAGLGSAKGVNLVGEAVNGLLSENPTMFGKAFALEALPMTQGIYGLVAAFMILVKIGVFGGDFSYDALSVGQGMYFLMAALPIGIVGFFSALRQAKSAASGVNLLAKRPEKLGQAITSAALVETYAIFALLITLLAVMMAPAI